MTGERVRFGIMEPAGQASDEMKDQSESTSGSAEENGVVESTQADVAFLAKWDANDPDNPMNFSPMRKAWLVSQLSLIAFAGASGASITSPAEPTISAFFDISRETTVLTVSLFILGFAFGPMLWGPLGEVYGRRVSMLPAMVILGLFSIGTAASTNPASVFITRFFGGLFGSAPVSNVAAA
jgi:hypothetical protein